MRSSLTRSSSDSEETVKEMKDKRTITNNRNGDLGMAAMAASDFGGYPERRRGGREGRKGFKGGEVE